MEGLAESRKAERKRKVESAVRLSCEAEKKKDLYLTT